MAQHFPHNRLVDMLKTAKNNDNSLLLAPFSAIACVSPQTDLCLSARHRQSSIILEKTKIP